MTFRDFLRSRLARHGAVWLMLLTLPALMQRPAYLLSLKFLRGQLVQLACLAWPLYAHLWLVSRFFNRRQYGAYLVLSVAVVVAGALLFANSGHLAEIIMVADDFSESDMFTKFGQALFDVVVAILLSLAARYLRRGIVSHYQMQQLRARQLDTELRLLKAQVNQHFLFNTLNNLYGLSLAAPEQLPEALLKLAELMRYQLDGSQQTLTTVGSEAAYLANYIGLEKLRLRSNSQVEFTAELPQPDQPLAPLLLLPLVENCFKHAIGPGPGPNTIRIELTQTATGLTLRTANSIPPHFRPAPSGLGLPTLRARLAQFYPGARHRLAVEASAQQHVATLTLVLGGD